MARSKEVVVKDFISGSATRFMVLAILCEDLEVYKTVKLLMDKLQFESFSSTVISNVKRKTEKVCCHLQSIKSTDRSYMIIYDISKLFSYFIGRKQEIIPL